MGNKKLVSYVLLTSLGFLAAILVGIFMFSQFRNTMLNYSHYSHITIEDQIHELTTTILSNMTQYVEDRYPVLKDTEKLKAEAGTDWFWDLSDEWRSLIAIFNFAYIYYVEKVEDNYIFLMSSGIQRDEHPEWLGTRVWLMDPPGYIQQAYNTRELAISPTYTDNEWGKMISAARAIMVNGEVAGILGIDYDIAFLDAHMKEEQHLREQGNLLLTRMRSILIISIFIIIVFMGYQIWLSTTSVIIPLRELEEDERTRIMLDATPMICSLWDIDGNPVDCNGEALKIFDLSRKSEFIDHFFDLNPEYQPNGENSRTGNKRYIGEALESGYARYEWMYRTKSGADLPVEKTIVRVPLKDSYCLTVYSRDLREEKEREAALQESRRELAIAKEQAERALESELQYNQAKSDFLSRVSHELRTPINAITGITGVAKKTDEKKDLDQCFTKIEEASDQLLGLVNNILDLTGIDTGKFDFTPAPFSLGKAINSVARSFAQKAKIKEQEFIANIESGMHDRVSSDERRFKQILRNLLSNAVKFTPEKGKIELTVRMTENDGNECTIRVEVLDNGIGIEKEKLKRLGEVFEQADNSITREHSGMGLSLSLTRRIVEFMKGRMWVESEPGKFSRFSCDLRLGIAEEEEGEQAKSGIAETENSDLPPVIDFAGKRILVVDDVDINREIIVSLLEDTGAILSEAGNGNEAVKLCLQDKCDLVLMDLHMPIMDGYSAAKIIRSSSLPWARTVPIIALSAESSGEIHAKCQEAGISDYMAKPVDMEIMYRLISKWIS